MANLDFYTRDIANALGMSFSDAESREEELNGMILTTKIKIYADDFFYSGTASSNPSSFLRIQAADKKYRKSGYEGVPYHYIVTNSNTKTQAESGIYSVYNTNYATPLSDSDICIALMCRPGTSLDREDLNNVDNLIDNLTLLLRYLVNTKHISFKNIDLNTTAKNATGKKSVNGGEAFMAEFLKGVTEDSSKQYDMVVDREDIDFVVIAGPSSNSKRTLGALSKTICGEVNEEFIDFMKELNPDCISSKASASTVIDIGTFLYIPANTGFIEKTETEAEIQSIEEQSKSNNNDLLYLSEYIERYKNSVSYIDSNRIHYLSDETKQTYSTARGGKTDSAWQYQNFEFPGYHNAFLQFDKIGSNDEPIYLHFLISPSDISESRGNIIQDSKTMGGWISQRCGPNAISIQFSGVMLDIKAQMERHNFLENYKAYIEDTKVEDQTYVNYYKQKLVVEGRDYYGHVVSIDFSKNAKSPFIYNYRISFTAYNDKKIYDAEWGLLDMSWINQGVISNNYLSGIVAEITKAGDKAQYITEENLSDYVDKGSEAYKYLLSLLQNAAGDEKALERITQSLNSYANNNHWAKKYLDALISANVVTNIEDWGNYESTALMSHSIALMYKALIGGRVSIDGYKYWSQAYMDEMYNRDIVSKQYVSISTYEEWLSQINKADPETLAMLKRWILEIAFYVISKKNSSTKTICNTILNRFNNGKVPMENGYYAGKQKYNSIYECYLDALCITQYINTPSEWNDFGNNAKTTNANVLALVAKLGGYSVKD